MLDEFFIDGKGNVCSCIRLLFQLAVEDPFSILEAIGRSIKKHKFSMIPIGMAILYGKSGDGWLIENQAELQLIINKLQPDELLLFVEFMKEKVMGRGLGSRPQKAIANVMEGWKQEELKMFCAESPTSMNRLIRMIHPSYNDNRKFIIKDLLKHKYQ